MCREYNELYGRAQNIECNHQINAISWGKVLGEGCNNILLWYRWYFLIMNTEPNALFSIVQTVWENGPPKPDIFVSLSCSPDTSSSLVLLDIYKAVIVRTTKPQSSAEVKIVLSNQTTMNSSINTEKPVIYSTLKVYYISKMHQKPDKSQEVFTADAIEHDERTICKMKHSLLLLQLRTQKRPNPPHYHQLKDSLKNH